MVTLVEVTLRIYMCIFMPNWRQRAGWPPSKEVEERMGKAKQKIIIAGGGIGDLSGSDA